jgi:predicted nucleic acid-binding protein
LPILSELVLSGPAVFDTSAQSYFARQAGQTAKDWLFAYSLQFRIHLCPLTAVERMRGYWILLRSMIGKERAVEQAMHEYLRHLRDQCDVLNFDSECALVSATLMALCPNPPSPPRRSHRMAESRQDRLSRWRFDIMIAATALVTGLPLIHNNPQDFEPLRGLIERMPERFPGVGPLNLISVKRLAA